MPEPSQVLYAEPGSSWWPLAWGPLLALPGVLIGGGAFPLWLWLLVGAVLTLFTAAWVAARRRFREVRLTPSELRGGREVLPVARIAEIDDVGTSMGAPVVGGSWVVPRGTTGIPLRLDDGSTVLAWARDADALSAALRRLVGAEPAARPSGATTGDAPSDTTGDATGDVPSETTSDTASGTTGSAASGTAGDLGR